MQLWGVFFFLNSWCREKASVTVGVPGSMETPPLWHPFLSHVQPGEDRAWYRHMFWAVPYPTGDILGTVCKEMLQMSRGAANHHLARKWVATSLSKEKIYSPIPKILMSTGLFSNLTVTMTPQGPIPREKAGLTHLLLKPSPQEAWGRPPLFSQKQRKTMPTKQKPTKTKLKNPKQNKTFSRPA